MDTCSDQLCRTPGCPNKAAHKRKVCHACKQRNFRKKRPYRAAYATLRDHARGRNIAFSLSFSRFLELCEEGLFSDGVRNTNMHVDRVDVSGGYSDDNVQVLPFYENIAKGNTERYGKHMLCMTNRNVEEAEEVKPIYETRIENGEEFIIEPF